MSSVLPVREGGASLAFVLSPLLASTNVRWTMTQMNEKLVSLWGGEELGWCGAHPMKLFNLGGEVKSREHKLGEWQCFRHLCHWPSLRGG